MKQKLVFRDGDSIKVLKGTVILEDDFFLTFECDYSKYRINKKDVISVKSSKGG